MTKIIFYSVYLFVTFMYGTIFTIKFLDVKLNRKNTVILLLFSGFDLLLQGLIGYKISYAILISCYPIVVHLPLLLICIFVYKRSFITSISSICMGYFLTSPRFVIGELINAIFPSIPYPEVSGRIIATFIMTVIICIFILKPVKYAFKRPKQDVSLFFYPLIVIYCTSYIIITYTNLLEISPNFVIELIYTLFFSFVLYYIEKYYVAFDEKVELEKQQNFIKLSTDSIKKQVTNLMASNEQTRILRHDIRHFCNIINQYADEEKLDKIKEYVGKINTSVEQLTPKTYCENFVINAIITSYMEPFNKINCLITTDINVPEKIFVDNTDLCIILANALENAYHSCEKATTPFLNVKIDTLPNCVYINIRNKCESKVDFDNGIPITDNNKNVHGYGTKSIAMITEKYNGIYKFALENDIFTLKIILHS